MVAMAAAKANSVKLPQDVVHISYARQSVLFADCIQRKDKLHYSLLLELVW
jgi:hypothetical protein